MQLFGLSRRRRRGGGGFDPSGLFANGEAGVWYDPSDLSPEKVSWRRNLLTYSEQFDDASWTKANTTATANQAIGPDGTSTADLIAEAAVTDTHQVFRASNVAITSGLTYTFSVFLKKGTGATAPNIVQLTFVGGQFGTGQYANFNLNTGAVGTNTGVTASIVNVGSGWYRCIITRTATASSATSAGAIIAFTNNDDGLGRVPSYAGVTTNDVFAWGAQLELGTTASAYQRITDFNSDFLDAFPTHTLYQNSTGTTPVTALGQSVGLVLDKSRWDGRGVVNLLTYSEQFDVLWSKDDVTVTANQTTAPDGTSTADLVAETATTVPHFVSQTATAGVANYVFSVFAKKGTGATAPDWIQLAFGGTNSGYVNFNLSTGAVGVIGVGAASIENVGGGWYQCIASINNGTAGSLGCRVAFTNNTNAASRNPSYTGATTSNVFVWGAQLERGSTVSAYQANVASVGGPGNHAIQTTSASRPTLQARSNLLTYSEQFDNAVWVKSGVAGGSAPVVVANDAVAPDGTTTADRITFVATSGQISEITQSLTLGAATYAHTVYLKAFAAGDVGKQIVVRGAVGGAYQIVTLTAQWQLVQWNETRTSSGTGLFSLTLRPSEGSSSGTVAVHAWGAQLELGSTASTYQRVVTATDYADVGLPRSLTFDGTDDSLVTAASVNFSGTDKMTVCAGVFKASDATFAPVVETSATSSTTNGAFAVFAPYSNTEQNYGLNSRGTSLVSIAGPASGAGALPAPNTSVLSMLTDISGPSALMRQNGATYISSVNSQGTGNYASHLLFIGRRNNATSPLNGRLYQLIVRGAATDSVTVINTERYVAQKTGVTL